MPRSPLTTQRERTAAARRLADRWSVLQRAGAAQRADLLAGLWYLSAEILGVWAGLGILVLLSRVGVLPQNRWINGVLSVAAMLWVPVAVTRWLRRENSRSAESLEG